MKEQRVMEVRYHLNDLEKKSAGKNWSEHNKNEVKSKLTKIPEQHIIEKNWSNEESNKEEYDKSVDMKTRALLRREHNISERKELDHNRLSQSLNRPYVYSYHVHVQNDVYQLPIGWQKDHLKKTNKFDGISGVKKR